jgi:hypothetical protein
LVEVVERIVGSWEAIFGIAEKGVKELEVLG